MTVYTDPAAIGEVLSRSVAQILPAKEELRKQLASGRRLSFYMGTQITSIWDALAIAPAKQNLSKTNAEVPLIANEGDILHIGKKHLSLCIPPAVALYLSSENQVKKDILKARDTTAAQSRTD